MPNFIIPCRWEVMGWYRIEAETAEEAVIKAKEEQLLPTRNDTEYLDDSFEILYTDIEVEAQCGKTYPINRRKL